jgi:hypothetical protein
MIRTLAVAAFVVAATALGAAPAHADQYDFISRLDENGVSYTGYMSDMIDLGKVVCHELRMGTPVPMVVNYLMSRNFPGYDAGIIIGAAAGTMCPDTWPFVSQWANSPEPAPPPPQLLPAI